MGVGAGGQSLMEPAGASASCCNTNSWAPPMPTCCSLRREERRSIRMIRRIASSVRVNWGSFGFGGIRWVLDSGRACLRFHQLAQCVAIREARVPDPRAWKECAIETGSLDTHSSAACSLLPGPGCLGESSQHPHFRGRRPGLAGYRAVWQQAHPDPEHRPPGSIRTAGEIRASAPARSAARPASAFSPASTPTPPAPKTCTLRCPTECACFRPTCGPRATSPADGQDPYRSQRRETVPVVLAPDRRGLSRLSRFHRHPALFPLGSVSRAAPSLSSGSVIAHRHQPGGVVLTRTWPTLPDPGRPGELYYDTIAHMDDAIGDDAGGARAARKLRQKTLVLFLSDNGAPFPREKGTLYDAGTRTPLVFSWPSVIPAGTVYDRGLVSTVDLTPTLLDLAGAGRPDSMQGQSFSELLTRPTKFTGRTRVFSERNWHDCDEHQRAVRTLRFKLIRTDAYTDLPLCTAADIGASPSFLALRARAKAGRLTSAQRRLFEVPRARLELYDLKTDPVGASERGRRSSLRRSRCAAWRPCSRTGWSRPTTSRPHIESETTTPTESPACRLPARSRRCAIRTCLHRLNAGVSRDPPEDLLPSSSLPLRSRPPGHDAALTARH